MSRVTPIQMPWLNHSATLLTLLFFTAPPSLVAEDNARGQTIREELGKRAEAQWAAANDTKRPSRAPKEAAAVQEIFNKIDALTKMKSLSPKEVAKTLGLRLKYEKTGGNEYFSFYEARLSDGDIRGIEVRVSSNAMRGLAIVEINPVLRITPGEIIDRFGHAGITGPSIHAPADDPYYYHYSRPGGELRIGVKPGAIHTLVSVVWDTIPVD